MGVMACNRRNCDNIMCKSYSDDFGYICTDCYKELEHLKPSSVDDIRGFMDTSDRYIPFDTLELSDYFKI